LTCEIEYTWEGQVVRVPLEQESYVIGREPGCDIVLPLASISRQHARLQRDGASWRIVDLGSLNGTWVNDAAASGPLADGDTVRLDRFPLTFRDPSASWQCLSVALTLPADDEPPQPPQTFVQSAVAFSELAARPPDLLRLQRLLAVVTRASEAVLTSPTLEDTFERVLQVIFEQLPVQRGCVLLWNAADEAFTARAIRQVDRSPAEHEQIRFSRTIAERVVHDKLAVLTRDAQLDGRFAAGESVMALGIRSAMAAPIWSGERVEGLLYVDTLKSNVFDQFDLDLLSALGNQLAVAMEQSRLQQSVFEQQLVRRRLERYHSPAVVELITAGPPDATVEPRELEVTVLFADIVGFTRRCEGAEPKAVAELLNRYFSEMEERVFRHDGTVDKFIGDCVMAVFGAPLAAPDHARRAVETALDMREAMEALNAPLPEEARVHFRVGLHSGRVVAGDIGSARRTDYTVLGATVNLASRIEALAAPDAIVLSAETLAAAGPGFATCDLGLHTVRGLSHPVHCFELVGRADAVSAESGGST
jgi:adenylate cyclase